MKQNNGPIIIWDLYLAAYFKAKGLALIGAEKRRGYPSFCFEPAENTDSLIRLFVEDSAMINVKSFKHSLRDPKNIISGDFPVSWINTHPREMEGQDP